MSRVDATCVGKSIPETIKAKGVQPLLILANGHGCRQMCRMDRYGFPRTGPKEAKFVKGFQTGDIVKVRVTSGKKVGKERCPGMIDARTVDDAQRVLNTLLEKK